MSTTDNTPNANIPDDEAPREAGMLDSSPHDETLADEVLVDTAREPDEPPARPTTAQPATAAVGTVSTTTTTTPATTAPDDGPWLQGAAPFAIVLGLLGLLLAGAVLVGELTDLTFPWADLGPWTVVAAGLVIVLVGAIGLRSSRRAQG
jgi:hypothetical protein